MYMEGMVSCFNRCTTILKETLLGVFFIISWKSHLFTNHVYLWYWEFQHIQIHGFENIFGFYMCAERRKKETEVVMLSNTTVTESLQLQLHMIKFMDFLDVWNISLNFILASTQRAAVIYTWHQMQLQRIKHTWVLVSCLGLFYFSSKTILLSQMHLLRCSLKKSLSLVQHLLQKWG